MYPHDLGAHQPHASQSLHIFASDFGVEFCFFLSPSFKEVMCLALMCSKNHFLIDSVGETGDSIWKKQTGNPVRGWLGWYTVRREHWSSLRWEWIGLKGNREQAGTVRSCCMPHENIMNMSQWPNGQHIHMCKQSQRWRTHRGMYTNTNSTNTAADEASAASVSLETVKLRSYEKLVQNKKIKNTHINNHF